jgi:leucyl-tRNA synthetase
MLHDDSIEYPIQFKGRIRAKITLPADADAAAVEAAVLADERITTLLEGAAPRKVIVVPGKIVNIIP